MDITRRDFVGYAAAAAALPLMGGRARASSPREVTHDCVLLDLGVHGSLRESTLGYAAALANTNRCWTRVDAPLLPCRGVLIVPGMLSMPPSAVRAILSALDDETTVVLESGAGFASATEVRAHRALVRSAFQIDVDAPVDVWEARTSGRGIPYMQVDWPTPATIRDFSRVLPIFARDGDVIARVNSLSVGVKRAVGRGTLVFLGSPIGPALWAGDLEACRWLNDVLQHHTSWPRSLIATSRTE